MAAECPAAARSDGGVNTAITQVIMTMVIIMVIIMVIMTMVIMGMIIIGLIIHIMEIRTKLVNATNNYLPNEEARCDNRRF